MHPPSPCANSSIFYQIWKICIASAVEFKWQQGRVHNRVEAVLPFKHIFHPHQGSSRNVKWRKVCVKNSIRPVSFHIIQENVNLATWLHFDAKGEFITLAQTLSSFQIAECDLELIKLIHWTFFFFGCCAFRWNLEALECSKLRSSPGVNILMSKLCRVSVPTILRKLEQSWQDGITS